MIDEINYVKENALKVASGRCPTVPLLCYLSNDKANLKRIPMWGKIHHDYFVNNSQAEFIDLECGHYVHREAPQRIADTIGQIFS